MFTLYHHIPFSHHFFLVNPLSYSAVLGLASGREPCQGRQASFLEALARESEQGQEDSTHYIWRRHKDR